MSEQVNRLSVRSLAMPLCTAAALSGCMTADMEVSVSTVDQSLSQQMSIDSQYMMARLDIKSEALQPSVRIDLVDPAQRRFVMNRLAAAGKTAENSPFLFERIQESTTKALARAAGTVTTNAVATDWCRNFIMLGSEVKTSATTIQFRKTHPNVTCVGGAAYVYADITTYNANQAGTEHFVVQSAAGEDYSGGTNFGAVVITPTLPAVLGRVNKTDSLVIAYDDLGNEQITYFAVESAMTPVPGTITVTHPVFHTGLSNGGSIQMCQLRGLPSQCDYAVGSLAAGVFTGWTAAVTGIAAVKAGTATPTVPWAGNAATYLAFPATKPYNASHIYLPTQGTFDVGATATGSCAIKSIVKAELRLIKTVDGGSCATTASFASGILFPVGGRIGSFKTISDFVNDGGTSLTGVNVPCSLNTILNEAVKGVMTIQAKANCGGPTDVTRFLTLGPDAQNPALTRLLFFLNSCFAEGTGIRRANGSSVAVEKIKAGDKVIADNKGTVLTVTGVSHGNEDEPLVELRDNKGHRLRLTAKHPLVKASGEVVFASSLEKDDKVMTDRGIASIVSTSRVPYTGQVYNLSLGTPEEKAKVGKDGTTMFAGGFLAGDSGMQQAHEARTREVAQVPTQWQRDYQNAVAGNPPMQRVLR